MAIPATQVEGNELSSKSNKIDEKTDWKLASVRDIFLSSVFLYCIVLTVYMVCCSKIA